MNSAMVVMLVVMLVVMGVHLVPQTSWIWCPYSHCVSGMTQILPLWADGLERSLFWAVYPSFPGDGLERYCCHNKLALNGLYFFCRLCHLGLGSCMSIHNLRFG